MSVSLSETFNTADSTTLGPNLAWTEVNDNMEVLGNQAHPVTLGAAFFTSARCNTDLGTTNMFAQCIVPTLTLGTSGGPAAGVAVRFADAADTYYTFNVYKNATSPNGHWQLESVAAGTETLIQGADYAWVTNDIVYLSAVGTTITAKINGATVASVTNSTLTTGTKAGFVMYRNVAGDDARLDNFLAGTFPGFPAKTTRGARRTLIVR